MNKNTKIIIGVGVGLGLAYLLFGKKKAKPQVKSTQPAIDVKLPEELEDVAEEDALNEPQTREEQIAFIMENTESNIKEESSGFEGTKFVWNPNFGRYYPIGTIKEGQMPSYADNVFNGFEGLDDLFIGFDGDIDPVQESANTLNQLTDKELKLATNIVKMRKYSPSAMSEAQALKEISNNDPKLQEIVKTRITPRLNDVKVMKKIPTWKQLWERRKKTISSIREKAKVCGRRPLFNREKIANWKNCIKDVSKRQVKGKAMIEANRKRDISEASLREGLFKTCGKQPNPNLDKQAFMMWRECAKQYKAQNNMSIDQVWYNCGIKPKINKKDKAMWEKCAKQYNPQNNMSNRKSSFSGADYNESRQKEFVSQVTNRMSGGMFAGRRFDGRSNKQEETLVREGIV